MQRPTEPGYYFATYIGYSMSSSYMKRVLIRVEKPEGYRSLKASFPGTLTLFTHLNKYRDYAGPLIDTFESK
jgi:hypothetical protein